MKKTKPHTMKPMTPAEMVKRLTGIQSGTWHGYAYEAEWESGSQEWWLTSDDQGPNTWTQIDIDWEESLTKHLNRFYDNESNPGPAYEERCKVWKEESEANIKAIHASREVA